MALITPPESLVIDGAGTAALSAGRHRGRVAEGRRTALAGRGRRRSRIKDHSGAAPGQPRREESGMPDNPRAGSRLPGIRHRKRPAIWRVVNGALLAALATGLFGFLPQPGGFGHDAAAELRHAAWAPAVSAVLAQAASLGWHALSCRRALASLGRGRPPGSRSRSRPVTRTSRSSCGSRWPACCCKGRAYQPI